MECKSVVNQKVCIEARVTVEPEAKIGDVDAFCVGKPEFEECEKRPCGCTYMVSQMFNVRFPLTISATATAKPAGIVCCKPSVEPCHNDDEPCKKETMGGEIPPGHMSAPSHEHPDGAKPPEEHSSVNRTYDVPKRCPQHSGFTCSRRSYTWGFAGSWLK